MISGFQLGPLYIHFYGIILMLGALAGAWLASTEARRRGFDTDIVWDGLVWVLIGGVLGARIWHILTPPPAMYTDAGVQITTGWYLTHPLDLHSGPLAVWHGGLGIPGAVIGGVLALYLFCRRRELSFLLWTDIAAPGLALGQAIGRWGNYVNQELYGAPSNLPWAIHIDAPNRLPGYENIETFHPLFLYESLWSLFNMGLLLWVARRYDKQLKPGDVFLVYLVIYPLGRFLLEFLRLGSSMVGGININQTFMGVVALCAAITLFVRHRPSKNQPEAPGKENSEA